MWANLCSLCILFFKPSFWNWAEAELKRHSTNFILSCTDSWCLAPFSVNISCNSRHKVRLCFGCRMRTLLYRVSHELRSQLRESVPYVKIYRCNPKHLCPKLNGFGDNDERKVCSSSGFHVLYLFSWLTRDHNLHVLESGKQTRSRRFECIIGVSAYATQSLLMRAENW